MLYIRSRSSCVRQPPDPGLLEAALVLPVQRWGYPLPRAGLACGSDENDDDANNNDDGDDSGGGDNDKRRCYDGRKERLMLHVRPGPKGAENAVTFVAQSLIPRGDRGAISVRLDCSESVNASPLPGSLGLSREVGRRLGGMVGGRSAKGGFSRRSEMTAYASPTEGKSTK